MISEMPKSPITSGTSPTPSISSVIPKVKRVLPETVSVPTVPAMIPKQAIMSERIIEAPVRKLRTTMPMHMREKYSGGPNFRAKLGQRGRHEDQADDAERPGDEGAEGGHAQGRAGPALARHLVAVQAGHDRGGLAGDVHQDGGGRAAVHGPVVDSGQHDDGRDRRDVEGGRQEQRHGGRRAQARQDADERADQAADEAVEEVRSAAARRRTR